jgi:hypothetical protein
MAFKNKLIFILFFICISFSSIAQVENILNRKVTLKSRNQSLTQILTQISEKEGIGFSYGENVMHFQQIKSIDADEAPLRNVLNELMNGSDLTYKVVGNQIVLQLKSNIPKKITISGYVKEQGSGETLIGVNVYIPSLKIGTVTNTYGFYSITFNASENVSVDYSFVGYKTISQTVNAESQEINISLEPGTMLNEVVVSAEAGNKQSEKVQMSTISVPIAQIKNVPSLLGEKDVLKVLQLMPGVQKGMEGSSGVYVRGGGPDQNLIILDDAIVYNASHLFGFFSLFNGDALKSVELTKGGFPARYGGRLSSVIDMNMKEGNKEAWHGEGGIGLISSRLTIEGPLKKNKSSILLSTRRTYIDFITRPLTKSTSGDDYGYYFYDMNAKFNYDFGRKNKLYLSGYFGKDKFNIKTKGSSSKEEAGFNWGNATATMRWNHLFNSKLFMNTSAVFSNYKFKIFSKDTYEDINRDYKVEYYSQIRDYTLKTDFDYIINAKHWIKAGLILIQHEFSPYAYVEDDEFQNLHKNEKQKILSHEMGGYLEDTYQPFESLKINGGLRYSLFVAKNKVYNFLEPRLSAAYRVQPDLAIKASYATMNQYVHMLSNTGVSLPTDLWVPSTQKVRPQHSTQYALGVAKDINHPSIMLSLEGYYKEMDNIIGYKEGASYILMDESNSASESKWEDNITSGRGWSYGIEFFAQKKTGRFNGWIGYTLSWTQLQFDSINFGRKYFARYDRRHDISVVGMYKLTDKITLSATWVYGTGNSLTLPVAQYKAYSHQPEGFTANPGNLLYEDEYQNIENKNNFRMGAYHRLDIGIQFHKQKKWGERIWEISVYNVYNRKNPFFYYGDTKDGVGVLKQVSLFPIIPSFTYTFKF